MKCSQSLIGWNGMPKCFAEDNHLFIGINGKVSMCCRNHSHSFDSQEEMKNSDFFKEFKEQMKNGWHPSCSKCKDEEEAKGTSYRTAGNGKHLDGYFVEISLSNQCNIKCVTCSPEYSSTWAKHLGVEVEQKKFDIEQVDWSKVTHLKYLGGEPFITPEFFEVLEKPNKETSIEFFTNGTLYPTKKIQKLKAFKKLKINFSIDGIGETFEMIREGANWKKVDENIEKFAKVIGKNHLNIFMTVSVWNVHQMKDVKKYADSKGITFSYSYVVEPLRMSIEAMPLTMREMVRDEVNTKILDLPFCEKKSKKFLESYPNYWKTLT